MKTFELGIMSNKWTLQAENADIAVCTIRLFTQSEAPIAIYSPEGEASRFAVNPDAEELDKFLSDVRNKQAISAAYGTLPAHPLEADNN